MHRSRLPVLQPCDQDWAKMPGGAAARRCGACEREVLDLSAMHAEAAIDAVFARRGGCVRYRVDAAGEVQFAPAPARRPVAATAALVLAACAGWTPEPEAVVPGELGVCVADGEEAGACEGLEEAPSREVRGGAVEPEAPPEPESGRDYAGPVEVEAAAADTEGVPAAEERAEYESMVRPEDDHGDGMVLGTLIFEEHDPDESLFDKESTAAPGRDWWATAEAMRVKRQLRREARQQRREARRRG